MHSGFKIFMELNSILYAAITKEICDRACVVNSYETITKSLCGICTGLHFLNYAVKRIRDRSIHSSIICTKILF